jgi:hypothetical protein
VTHAGHRRQVLGRSQWRRQHDPDAKDVDVVQVVVAEAEGAEEEEEEEEEEEAEAEDTEEDVPMRHERQRLEEMQHAEKDGSNTHKGKWQALMT